MSDVVIDYTNWKGERGHRHIAPKRIFWGSNEWHTEPQWLLEAFDVDKNDTRVFAIKDIHTWDKSPDADAEYLRKAKRVLEMANVHLMRQRDDAEKALDAAVAVIKAYTRSEGYIPKEADEAFRRLAAVRPEINE